MIVILIVAVILVLLEIWRELHSFKIEEYIVETHKFKKNGRTVKIVFLSDIHNFEYGKRNSRLLASIKKQVPDFILIGGDLLVYSEKFETDKMEYLLEELCKVAPVYYSYGNHEKKLLQLKEKTAGKLQRYVERAEAAGVQFLRNESETILVNQQQVCITGLDLDLEYYKKGRRIPQLTSERLSQYIGTRTGSGSFQILLAHNPLYFKQYASWGADVVLAGHVHGGVVRLPLLGGVISTTFQLFPKYDAGRFQEKQSTMVLSRGLGVHTIKMRLFNIPEVSVVIVKETF